MNLSFGLLRITLLIIIEDGTFLSSLVNHRALPPLVCLDPTQGSLSLKMVFVDIA